MAKRKYGKNEILLELGAEAVEAAKKALLDGAELIVRDAKILVPVRTGRLRDSIRAEVEDKKVFRVKIVADARNERGIAYGKYVEFWPGREKPFLYPAYYANRDKIREMVADAVRKAVRR